MAKRKAAKPGDAETTAEKQQKRVVGRPFPPGQSGNPAGRPKGSRNALCKRYIEDLQKVWDELNDAGAGAGIEAIRAVAKDRPTAFLTAVGNLVPREYDMGERTQDAFREFLTSARDAGKAGPVNPHKGDDE